MEMKLPVPTEGPIKEPAVPWAMMNNPDFLTWCSYSKRGKISFFHITRQPTQKLHIDYLNRSASCTT